MKKIWKNLCAVSMALACGMGVAGCGDDGERVSVDLDGDGVISSWENIFAEKPNPQLNVTYGERVDIKSVDDFLAISNKPDIAKVFCLKNNLDLGGREVSINLGKSEFYGNGYTISNFKLGSAKIENVNGEENFSSTNVKCLFYNGTAVNDVRIFMGVQDISINSKDVASYYSASLCFNVPAINHVDLKGRLNINSVKKDGRLGAYVDASLLYSGITTERIEGEDETVVVVKNNVAINNVVVDGVIDFQEDANSQVYPTIGSIASRLTSNSIICDSTANVKILAGVSSTEAKIGGLVGENLGFVTSNTFSGSIILNNNKENYIGDESVGGIVGYNGKLAEIKNCITDATITFKNNKKDFRGISGEVFVGGIAGRNDCGVIELCTSDAVQQYSNFSKATIGGFVGYNNYGVISYALCRGSIEINNVQTVSVAQVSGETIQGYFEKLVATTSINVDNSKAETLGSIKVGLVTIFDSVEESPYFNKILVDGPTVIFTKEGQSVVDYMHGLRCEYQVLVGKDDEEDVYETQLPSIFYAYRTNTLTFEKYTFSGDKKTNDGIVIKYLNELGTVTPQARWMIDYLDFKNYLNHNEVDLGSSLSLRNLKFTISDQSVKTQSYFGYSRYNGELCYFDQSFTQSYNHVESALGSCEHDSKDEMLSFIYSLINSNNGKFKEHYVIKLNDTYLGKNLITEDTVIDPGNMHINTYLLAQRLENVFKCLNTVPTIEQLAADGKNLNEDDGGILTMRYLQLKFSDDTTNYSMKIDISNLENEAFDGEYMLYLTFEISSKLG